MTQISGKIADWGGASLTGQSVTFTPTVTPLLVDVAGTWTHYRHGSLSCAIASDGTWISPVIPAQSVCDPPTVQWLVIEAEGTMWKVTVPASGVNDIHDLKNSGAAALVHAGSQVDNPIGVVSGIPGPSGAGMVWRGAWSSVTTYAIGDGVQRSGSSYIALSSTTNVDPATDGGVHWSLFAAAGSAGTTSDATTTAVGVVEIDHAPSGAHPVALTTDGTSVPSGMLGTTSTKAAAGNDSRLADARTPTAHASTHGNGGSDAVSLDASQIATGTIATGRLPIETSSADTTAGHLVQASDTRLSDTRTPTDGSVTTAKLVASAVTDAKVSDVAGGKITGSHSLADALLSTNVPLLNVDNTFTGKVTGTALIASGLTGATAASRYVGATASGAPVSGTFAIGDFVIDQTGKVYVCTVAGTPGTWTSGSGGSSTLAGDTDVSIASPATGDLLRYNGTAWANKALLATSEAVLGTDSAVVTASTFQDLVSSSLSAGTYLCIAHATAVDPTNAVDWAIRIWDGTTSYGGSEEVLLSTPFEQSTVCFGVVTLSGAGTIKLQGTSNATTTVFKAGPRVTSFGSQLTKLLTFKIG